MKIINLTDKLKLNQFIGSKQMSQFLESWEWGEFQAKVAEKIIRLGVLEDEKLMATATLIKKSLPFGKSYFLCPRGPIVGSEKLEVKSKKGEEILNFLFNEIKKYAEQEKVIFMRFEPVSIIHDSLFTIQRTLDVQPSKTLVLDLSLSEEELLKQMHQKTRYNIRLAEKKGVKIVVAGLERFDDFWQLMSQTGQRDNFQPHGRGYYKKMLETDGNIIKLYFAEYEERLIATGIFSWFGDTVTYLHGASANQERALMAPYLLHWEIIKQAKQAGFKYYDLFGINEVKWPGVTRFKKGFGGFGHQFPGTFDLVFNKGWYGLYKMIRRMRRIF